MNGVLRNKTLLDYNIDRFLKKEPGLYERIWLRMGFYQLSAMTGVKEYAAINETVELAAQFKKGTEKFINAVLRNFQRSGSELVYPDRNDPDHLSVRYSADRSIVDLWVRNYGEKSAEELLRASCQAAPLAIRVNTLKTDRETLSKELEDLGFETASSDSALTDTCLYVKGSGLLDTELSKEGHFAVQGESSQYAVRLLSPKAGSTIIDLCAAPGGKSCAMAALMEGQGRILAFDIYPHRVQLIEKEAKRLGIDIIKTEVCDSSVYRKELDSSADLVLADVPCSGLGTLREHPEIKYRTPAAVPSQKAILENALRYVKPGGRVLYSTCTIDPAENEEIIKQCEMIDSSALHGSAYDETKEYRVTAARQLFTKEGGHDGFYICLIQRKNTTEC